MELTKTDFEERLINLRKEYRKLLPVRLQEIQKAWDAICCEPEKEAFFQTLFRLVHSLSGSGRTFGFSKLSESAAEYERAINRYLEGQRSFDDNDRRSLEDHLGKLKAAAAQKDAPDLIAEKFRDEEAAPTPKIGQVVYWLGEDKALSKRTKDQFYYFGFDIYTFTDRSQLEERLAQCQPDALVLDCYGKNGDYLGKDAVSRFFDFLAGNQPVICLSPRGKDHDLWLHAFRGGAHACYTKPVQSFELLDKLDALTYGRSEKPYHILMIDDDEILANRTAAILGKAGMKVRTITDPLRSLECLAEYDPDLILMDLYMPQCSGLELAQIIRQDNRFLTIPIVYLSRETEVNKRIEAFESGADDFIFKPFKYRYLYYALSSRIIRARELRSHLTHDGLTGRLNPSAFREQLLLNLEQATQNRSELVFALVGIDNFKHINDHYGHAAGDRVLKALALMLKRRLGLHAVAGRYSGLEFAVVLPETQLRQTEKLLNRITQQFSKVVFDAQLGNFQTTISSGLASFPSYKSVGQLTEAAEMALVLARSDGGSTVKVMVPEQDDADARAEAESLLALDSDELIFIEEEEEIHREPVKPEPEPRAREPEEEIREETPLAEEENLPIVGKVVVVDDDEMVLKHTTVMLEQNGYRVFPASTGDEGFELAKQHHPDVVLTDLLLFPGIHGFELCDRIKHDPELDRVKIVLMTAVYKDYRYRMEGKDAGSDDFIEKPLNYDLLVNKIGALLDNPNRRE